MIRQDCRVCVAWRRWSDELGLVVIQFQTSVGCTEVRSASYELMKIECECVILNQKVGGVLDSSFSLRGGHWPSKSFPF